MPRMRVRSIFIAAVLTACGGSPKPATTTTTTEPTTTAAAARVLVLVDDQGVGLRGHDPVAYTTGTPAEGSASAASIHGGATYWFASPEHKATFDADPAKHAPAYGGYCAYAASQNRLSESDPKVFKIVDGQLLMFTNAEFLRLFEEDPAAHKAKADANWPGLVAKHGRTP